MNDDAVFAKTELGQQEIQNRSCGLDTRHRTLLIMLDGKRSVLALRALLGHGDGLAPMLLHLVELGLVTSSRSLPAASVDWTEQRQRATRLLTEILGPMGDGLAVRLESLKSPEQLPELLARCRDLVADVQGSGAAQRFEAELDVRQ